MADARRAARREAVLLTLALLAYSNGLAALSLRRGRPAESAYGWGNPIFCTLLVLAVARARRVAPTTLLRQIGLRRAGWPGAVAGGLLLGLGMAAPPLLFFARPLVLDAPLEYGPIGNLSPTAFRRRLLYHLPVGVALIEELLFRGLLWDSWTRAGAGRGAYLAGSAAFAGWHFAVSVETMRETNIAGAATPLPRVLQPHSQAIAVAGGMLTTGVAGLLFTLLGRRNGGNLLGPVVAHWVVDALMVIALYRRGARPPLDPPGGG